MVILSNRHRPGIDPATIETLALIRTDGQPRNRRPISQRRMRHYMIIQAHESIVRLYILRILVNVVKPTPHTLPQIRRCKSEHTNWYQQLIDIVVVSVSCHFGVNVRDVVIDQTLSVYDN